MITGKERNMELNRKMTSKSQGPEYICVRVVYTIPHKPNMYFMHTSNEQAGEHPYNAHAFSAHGFRSRYRGALAERLGWRTFTPAFVSGICGTSRGFNACTQCPDVSVRFVRAARVQMQMTSSHVHTMQADV